MQFERLSNNSAALIGCLAWIPLAVWILSCVNWTITGDIDVVTGIAGIAVALGLGYEAINPPVPQLAPLTVVAVFVTVLMFPFVRMAMEKKQLKNIDIEHLEKAYQSLGLRPDNVMAKFRIATVLFDLGVCGHAVRIAESLMPQMPQRFFLDEHRMLRRWQMTHLEARLFSPIPCSDCHGMNAPGNIFCSHCGAPYLIYFAKGRVVGGRLGKKLVATWISFIAILIGIPAAKALPPALSVLSILLMMGVAIGMTFMAFRDTTGGVAK